MRIPFTKKRVTVSFKAKEEKQFIPGEKCSICRFLEDGICLKRKKNPSKCNEPLLSVVTCPKCYRQTVLKRQFGQCYFEFTCAGTINGYPCGCRFSLTFRTGDSEEEESKARWLRGDGDEWTDASFSGRKRQ